MKHLARMTVVTLALLSMAAAAADTVVWCPKDGIGKSVTWKTQATTTLTNDVLQIQYTGAQWSGAGVNWAGYWPADAGLKASDYKYLVLEVKVEGAADALQIALKDNKHKPSGNVALKKYCPDGKLPADFATVKIPIADLVAAKSEFVTGVVWELMVHEWTQGDKDVKVTLRKIAFGND